MTTTRKSDFISGTTLPPEPIIFGSSSAMGTARQMLDKIALTPVPILLQGESGTGKDVFARLLHLRSKRSREPFVKVACPAIPQSLMEAELFGHEKGAFTGAHATKKGRVELAHRGTLFLDEVGNLENASQAKLLQIVQDGSFMRVGAQEERRVDTRLICAANANLWEQTEDGNFRLDFFFRISAVTIDLPPLRQRIVDLPILIRHFMTHYANLYQVEPRPLSREVLSRMEKYDWPGNIRQLENMIRSYALIGNEEMLMAELVPTRREGFLPDIDVENPISLKTIIKSVTRDMEREIILKVLRANGWNRQKTARWLNISYRSLLYKLQDVDERFFTNARNGSQSAAKSVAQSDQPGRKQS